MRGAGTDGFAGAMKPGNAGGARRDPTLLPKRSANPRGEEPVSEAETTTFPSNWSGKLTSG